MGNIDNSKKTYKEKKFKDKKNNKEITTNNLLKNKITVFNSIKKIKPKIKKLIKISIKKLLSSKKKNTEEEQNNIIEKKKK